MKLTKFIDAIQGLPADAQKLANKAMLYTAFAMQGTERQVLTNNGSRDTGQVVRTIGGGSVLADLKAGVVNEQTKKFTQTFRAIMEKMDRYQSVGGKYFTLDEYGNPVEKVGTGGFLTEEAYAMQKAANSRVKTDLRDDYPIVLSWQVQRVLMNETYLPGEKKEYYLNAAIERNGGALVRIEDNLVAAHVKKLPSWTAHPLLLEFYTDIQKPMPQFDALQTPQGINAVAGNISMVMLTQTSHQGDEIFGYRIREFDKCVVHNGQLVYKFYAESLVD
jgi:hypothetical protein